MKIDLNYASLITPYPLLARAAGALFGVGLLALVAWQGMGLSQRIEQSQQQAPVVATQARPSPQLLAQIDAARKVQQSLHTPWLAMLADLEQIKSQHAHIQLISVIPNPQRREIVITGEAKVFADITQFFDDLKRHPRFGDAALQHQHLVDPESNQPIYSFNAVVRWRDVGQEAL